MGMAGPRALRLKARTRRAAEESPDSPARWIAMVWDDVREDFHVARRTVNVAGRVIDLTPKEFGFLAALARHPGRVISHRMILEEVWGKGYGTETQYLRVYASQLRKKLEEDPARPRLVTEPGVGYRLVDPAED